MLVSILQSEGVGKAYRNRIIIFMAALNAF